MAMYPFVALRCPTYRENSHANHTWHQHSHQTACFLDPNALSPWVRFPSPAPLSSQCWPMRANELPLVVPSNKLAGVRWHWLWFHTQPWCLVRAPAADPMITPNTEYSSTGHGQCTCGQPISFHGYL
jgi:hypothetical protein